MTRSTLTASEQGGCGSVALVLALGCAFWLGARDVRGAEDVPLRPCLCFMLWLTWVKGVSSDVDEIALSGAY